MAKGSKETTKEKLMGKERDVERWESKPKLGNKKGEGSTERGVKMRRNEREHEKERVEGGKRNESRSSKPKKESKKCGDIKCPFHGKVHLRGRSFIGEVISTKMDKTAIVTWRYMHKVKKYERFERRKTKLAAHIPKCLTVHTGEKVKISECRPLSKTKSFVVVEVLRK